jgi:hypothetical protein
MSLFRRFHERRQYSLLDVFTFFCWKFAVKARLKVDIFPVFEDVKGANQVILIFVIGARLGGVHQPSFGPYSFPPTICFILDILWNVFVHIYKAWLWGMNDSVVTDSGFEEDGFLLW